MRAILECAQSSMRRGTEAKFAAVFPTAIRHIARSPGFIGHESHRSIETPTRYALLIRWRTLEDHTVGFRGSPAFALWRAHLVLCLDGAPVVEHFDRRF